MDNKKKLITFILFFVLALIFWRLRVFLFYNKGELPLLRAITGLTIHHHTYGVVFALIAGLLLIFYKANVFSVGLMGFGLGSVLDSTVSGLLNSNTIRTAEIARYNQNLPLTSLLFLSVIILSFIFYFFGKKIKKRKV